MDEAAKVMIPTLLIAVVLFMMYTGLRARKFEASHPTGVYKTKGVIRGLESLFLLAFAAAALLTLRSIIGRLPALY